jgi:hypothetical protein
MSNLELTYQSFISRISETAKKDALFKFARFSLLALTAFVSLALVLISAEAIFELGSAARKIFYFGYFSALAATIVTLLINLYSGFKNHAGSFKLNQYAKRIGSHYSEIRDNLLNAIQIYNYTKTGNRIFSAALAEETISQVNENSKSFDFKNVISFRKNNNLILFFVSSLLVFTLLMLAFPNVFQAAANRIVNYNFTFVENTLGIAYEINPGNIEITKGDNVDISAKIMFNDPNYKTDEITFCTKTVTNDGVEISSGSEKITALSLNEFKASLNNVSSNTVYWFEYKGIKSSNYNINITNKPIIKSVKITVYPPAYTRLPSRTAEGDEISGFGQIIHTVFRFIRARCNGIKREKRSDIFYRILKRHIQHKYRKRVQRKRAFQR